MKVYKYLFICRMTFVAYIVYINVVKVLNGKAESIKLSIAQLVSHCDTGK